MTHATAVEQFDAFLPIAGMRPAVFFRCGNEIGSKAQDSLVWFEAFARRWPAGFSSPPGGPNR